MRNLGLITAILFASAVAGSWADPVLAADALDNVCLVTYSNQTLAQQREVRGVAVASVLPRETALKLVTKETVVFTYPDQAKTVRACQCLNNPAPATSMTERAATLMACPKPLRE